MMLLIYLLFVLVPMPILIFIDSGFNRELSNYFEDLFYDNNDIATLFRICFTYLSIASIYRYVRYRRYVWDDFNEGNNQKDE